MEDPDVLVVGAGPTGLTLACGLAARGVRVRVVDRAAGPAATSRANILHARGAEVLSRAGALGDLRERSLEPVGMAMHVRGERLTTMRFLPDERETTQALFVSQAMVEAALRRRLADLGVEIGWATEVRTATQDADGVTVGLADGKDVRAGWLAGCDGARSTVRQLAGIEFPGVPVVEQFLLADLHACWDRDRTTSSGWFHRDGIVLALPMNGVPSDGGGKAPDLWRLMVDVPALDEHLEPEQILTRITDVLRARTGETGLRVRDAVWTSVFRIHRRLAADYRRGRILLAGDAAHIHSPIGGQGMNTGIGDAENLAWKLGLVVRGRATSALLDTYAAERRPLAAEVLRSTTANTRILVGEGPVARFLRDRLLIPVLGLAAVQRRATRAASQLWVSYRHGPLGGRGRAPRPGDRVRDLDCRRTDGTPTRLHAELGSRWVLLAPEPGPAADRLIATARTHLGDEVVLLHTCGPARLVRPDAHLAWREPDAGALQQWLTGTLRHGGTR